LLFRHFPMQLALTSRPSGLLPYSMSDLASSLLVVCRRLSPLSCRCLNRRNEFQFRDHEKRKGGRNRSEGRGRGEGVRRLSRLMRRRRSPLRHRRSKLHRQRLGRVGSLGLSGSAWGPGFPALSERPVKISRPASRKPTAR
jgi:hypothetical protein